MKRVISLLIVLSLVLCLAGCGKNDISSQSNKASENHSKAQSDNNFLLSVLYNKEPFITVKGDTVYLKHYMPFYKYPDDADYYEMTNIFVPEDYTFVDLDKDGNDELIITEALPYADSYLILHRENEKIYGYSLYNRWFQELKQDGSFTGSGGALTHNYNTISFYKNTYTVTAFAKYYFIGDDEKSNYSENNYVPDYDKSVFEIEGKNVSYEEIKKFAEEWEKRPNAEWIKFE